MKTLFTYTAVVLITVVSLLPTVTFGRGADSPRDSIIVSENLGLLSVGAAFDKQDREMISDMGAVTRETESHSYYAFLSLDVLPWVTITGGAGQTEAKEGKTIGYEDPDSLWMFGLVVNIWEQDIIRPPYLASRLSIQAAYSRWDHDAEMGGGEMQWTEDRVSLAAVAEFFVDHEAEELDEPPYSAKFSLGPVVSSIDGDVPGTASWFDYTGTGEVDFEEEEDVGILIGVDIQLADNFSIGWEGRMFEHLSQSVTAALHF
ncbi:MAG: hypothetical protein QGI24_01855 [Kiritimatiellia bacterium]|jgi:hypothetical protein|nr:hypothetical protein [Kiritimatiellia bacterium]MDP6847508.1 hypothetical protein [Kiritimatiellia bacterium]